MPHITRELIRKRAEHNEGIISSLEEISLHQEEIEGINEVLGSTCRKMKILYLQNNLIPKIENLVHLKELEYLNLALNNVTKIEGLQNCEFLKKLDLTVNFVDFDELESSVTHLASLPMLRDLYMMGNPAQANWTKFNNYIIARVPQLATLDGTEITKSMRIVACQQLPTMEVELRQLAEATREEKLKKQLSSVNLSDAPLDDSDMTENTPETRLKIYRELAEQKREKELAAKANAPRERNYEAEHASSVENIRKREEETDRGLLKYDREIRQKNEGGYIFRWNEEQKPGYLILEVDLPRHLDSSLVDVDLHPTYVSIVIKSKLLRLVLPAEVKASEAKCQRSKTTGSLVITMPKVNPRENILVPNSSSAKDAAVTTIGKQPSKTTIRNARPKKMSLQEQVLAAAQAESVFSVDTSSKAVDISSIVRKPKSEEAMIEEEKAASVAGKIAEID